MVKRLKVYRWFIWGSLMLAYLMAIVYRYSFGLIKDNLEGSFNMSSVAFANLSSMYFYAYMIMQIPTGFMVDSMGVRMTVTAGMTLAGAGAILFGCSTDIFFLFIGRLFVGVGVSVVFVSILKILSKWYEEKDFSTMSGFTTFIGNMGALFSQTPFVLLVAYLNWRYTYIMMGFATCLTAVLCFTIVRNNPKNVESTLILKRRNGDVKHEKIKLLKALKDILVNPYTWPSFIMYAGFYGAYQSLAGTWGQSYIMDVYGMSKITTADYMLLLFIGAAIGGITIGKLSDIFLKRKALMMQFGMLYLISWTLLVFLNKGKPPVLIMAILLFILGFSLSTITLSWACGKEVNNPEYTGISTSVINMGGFLGAAVVPVFFGMAMDRYKNVLGVQQLYNRAFFYCFISVVVGFVSILFIKETGCKNVYNSDIGSCEVNCSSE